MIRLSICRFANCSDRSDIWRSQRTRIDIVFVVSLLSRFASRPAQKDWNAAIHVLQYLSARQHVGLSYLKGNQVLDLESKMFNYGDISYPKGFVESDFFNDPDTLFCWQFDRNDVR